MAASYFGVTVLLPYSGWYVTYLGTTAYTVNKPFCFRFGGIYLSVLPALLLLPKKVGLKLGCVGPLTHWVFFLARLCSILAASL